MGVKNLEVLRDAAVRASWGQANRELSIDTLESIQAIAFGANGGEGLVVTVIEEVVDLTDASAVFKVLSTDVPAGAIVLYAQGNIEELVVAAGDSTRVGIGPSGTPVKYGVSTDKTKNQKIGKMGPWNTILGSAETIRVNAIQANGSDAGTGDISAGKVRVRVVYASLQNLADAA